ncbi:YgaP family membrane protein [Aeromonas veronii]|uniref:YgaP family membrane protein n=1 Tax=Aeromonas veronii TaxID=654 RepID=UPI003F796C7E
MFRLSRNERSHWSGNGVHVEPESVFMIGRNMQERVLRIILGIMALVFPVMSWGKSDLAVAAGVMSAILSMTGLMGFCPMCAMVGRKLDKRN